MQTALAAISRTAANLAHETPKLLWKFAIPAYAIMRNHYHLALRTPQPNLVEGMHCSRRRLPRVSTVSDRKRGHLFQGRYHALLVEDDAALARLVNYIHL